MYVLACEGNYTCVCVCEREIVYECDSMVTGVSENGSV